jgi:hypothetical protein
MTVMDKNEFDKLRDTVKAEYADKIKLLEDELQQKLEAIDTVAGMAGVYGERKSPRIVKKTPSETKGSGIVISEVIRETIDTLGDRYTLPEINNKMKEKHPEIEASKGLTHIVVSRLVKAGKASVAEKGDSKNPTVYQKIKQEELSVE